MKKVIVKTKKDNVEIEISDNNGVCEIHCENGERNFSILSVGSSATFENLDIMSKQLQLEKAESLSIKNKVVAFYNW